MGQSQKIAFISIFQSEKHIFLHVFYQFRILFTCRCALRLLRCKSCTSPHNTTRTCTRIAFDGSKKRLFYILNDNHPLSIKKVRKSKNYLQSRIISSSTAEQITAFRAIRVMDAFTTSGAKDAWKNR